MTELIIIGYDDSGKAQEAYRTVMSLQQDHVVELRGLAFVSVDADGKEHVDTPRQIVGSSTASGALWGLLLGMLFFVPGLGILGGVLGHLVGKLNKSGIDAQFREQVQDMLKPGGSAVVVMASKVTEDKFAAAMNPFGGTVLKTSLSDAAEKDLSEGLVRDA